MLDKNLLSLSEKLSEVDSQSHLEILYLIRELGSACGVSTGNTFLIPAVISKAPVTHNMSIPCPLVKCNEWSQPVTSDHFSASGTFLFPTATQHIFVELHPEAILDRQRSVL